MKKLLLTRGENKMNMFASLCAVIIGKGTIMPNARIGYLIVWLAVLNAGTLAAKTIYVDASGPAGGDGTTWSQAYTNLQTAITAANVTDDQIWVAQGTYYPGTARSSTFQPSRAVAFYGGFTNGMTSLSERDWNKYPTILSGDIGTQGDASDNIYRILTLYDYNGYVVNGFIITGASGSGSGGGIYAGANTTIENCTFRNNFADQQGAAVLAETALLVKNCVFSNNKVTNATIAQQGGGAIFCTSAGGVLRRIEGCLFTANKSTRDGGAIFANKSGLLIVSNSVFVGNQATDRGGAIQVGDADGASACAQTSTVVNCSFIGNTAGDGGAVCGADWVGAYTLSMVFKNCTFSGNTADSTDGGIYTLGTVTSSGENCIFWSDMASADGLRLFSPAKMTVKYSDLKGGTNAITQSGGVCMLTDGGGIINANPLYAGGAIGAWTAGGAYDAASGKTTLYRTGAGWTPGAWAGAAVNPGTNQALQFYVVTNDADTATVWGDASAIATNGAAYLIADYHEQSSTGRWTPLGWARDGQCSPCIDAGNPASAYENEPRPDGSRINMGAYGNTSQASKSIIARGTSFMVR